MSSGLASIDGRTFRSLRRHRNYRLFFVGQIVSVTGTWMQDVSLPWLVLALTHSPVDVGLIIVCRYAPFTLCGLVVGLLADRLDNRRSLMATEAASMTVAAALTFLTVSGNPSLWSVYLLATLGGIAAVFEAPNRHALAVQLVGRDELPNAIALNSSLFNAGRIVGPALAGILIGSVGISACFACNAASYLAVLVALGLMRRSELHRPQRGQGQLAARGAISAGLGFVWQTRAIRTIVLMTLVISLAGFNFRVLLPVTAAKTLHGGPGLFGVLWACFGLGALAGALFSATAARASWLLLLGGAAGLSATLIVIAPLHSSAGVAGLLVVVGFCFTVWTAASQSILQLTTPDALRGRVLSVYLWGFSGVAPLGALFSGWLAATGGTRLAFGVAGVSGFGATVYAAEQHGAFARALSRRVAPGTAARRRRRAARRH